MNCRVSLGLLGLCWVLSGCGTEIRTVPLNAPPRPLYARPAHEVHVYSTGVPNLPYVEVAALQGRQQSRSSAHEMPDIINAMRAEAGRMGCDGLILQGRADVQETAADLDVYTLEGFSGVCIVFVDPLGAQGVR